MSETMLKQFELASPTEDVSVSKVDALVKVYRELRDRKDELSQELKTLNEEVDLVESKLLDVLNKTGKKNWEVPGAGLVYKSVKLEVRFPEKIEDRKKVEAYVRKQYGEEMRGTLFTINYQSLNKFFKEEYDKACERGQGDSFKIPGLDSPTSREIIGFRRK